MAHKRKTCYLCEVNKAKPLDPNATPFNKRKHMVCHLHGAALYQLALKGGLAFDWGKHTVALNIWPQRK